MDLPPAKNYFYYSLTIAAIFITIDPKKDFLSTQTINEIFEESSWVASTHQIELKRK